MLLIARAKSLRRHDCDQLLPSSRAAQSLLPPRTVLRRRIRLRFRQQLLLLLLSMHPLQWPMWTNGNGNSACCYAAKRSKGAKEQEIVSRDRKDRRDYEQIANLAKRMGLYRWKCNRVEWFELKKLLPCGARGSRILVTTCDKSTAEIIGRNNLYALGALPDAECWSLFEKWAFGEEGSIQHPNLREVGEEIVNKCGGVPLAIRTVGGLLSGSKEESYWRSVKNSDTWGMGHIHERENGILSVLKLSYDQLPSSQLKECFAYCSMLPKGQEFDKQDLILLWMANGFIHSSDGKQQLEDIGSWYVNEFVSRSIFEVVRENHKAEKVKCRMHDLLHDLAKSVAGSLMVNSDTTKMNESTRHVSLWDKNLMVDLSQFLQLGKLRTLLLRAKLGNSSLSISHLDILLSGSTYLRSLDLCNSGLEVVPNSIGNMKHQRYLNLNGNTELQSLPESICNLHSLQTLKLSGCRKFSTFPRTFHHLVSLRYLVITSPYVLDEKIGTLTSLRWLTLEHCRNLVSFQVTQHLAALRTLCIHNLGKLTSLPKSLENYTALETLEVVNCPRLRSLEVCMQALSSLRSLTIKGPPKLATLPNKLECYATTSLQYLFIIDCLSLMTLPDCLGNLSSLMRIHIKYCPNLSKLPYGFSHLSALQVLQIDGCPLLSRRCLRNVGEDWKQIAHVREIFVDNVNLVSNAVFLLHSKLPTFSTSVLQLLHVILREEKWKEMPLKYRRETYALVKNLRSVTYNVGFVIVVCIDWKIVDS